MVARLEAEGRECSMKVNGSRLLPLRCICIGKVYRGYTRSTTEPSALSLRVTVVGSVTVALGCGSRLLPLRV